MKEVGITKITLESSFDMESEAHMYKYYISGLQANYIDSPCQTAVRSTIYENYLLYPSTHVNKMDDDINY